MIRGSKVIFVFHTLEVGGAEHQALLLARHLKEKGAHVQVWGLDKPGQLTSLCDTWGFPWRIVPFVSRSTLGRLLETFRFALALRREKPDLLLPYTSLPNLICGVVWRLCGARLCIWNQRDQGMDLDRKRLSHRLAALCTPLFISNSTHAKDHLVREFAVPPEMITVIHNGVTLKPAANSRAWWREFLQVDETTFVACMVANMHRYKDHLTLVTAWHRVVEEFPAGSAAPRLVLAGRCDGEEVPVVQLIERLGLGDQVTLLGAVEDVAGLFAAVDLCVHSSIYEGCPNAVLEAMAAGVAVVGTDIPGIREALGNDQPSCLAKPSDAAGLADAILRMALDERFRSQAGEANRLRARNEFSTQVMCDTTSSIITMHLA